MKLLPLLTLMTAAWGVATPALYADTAPLNLPSVNAIPLVAPATVPMIIPGAPVREVNLPFQAIVPEPGAMTLRGFKPSGVIEFGVRSDDVVTSRTFACINSPCPPRAIIWSINSCLAANCSKISCCCGNRACRACCR